VQFKASFNKRLSGSDLASGEEVPTQEKTRPLTGSVTLTQLKK
jgi:hypothetical protein